MLMCPERATLPVTFKSDIPLTLTLSSVAPDNTPLVNVATPSVIVLAITVSFTYNPLFMETSPSVINPPLIDKSSATIRV